MSAPYEPWETYYNGDTHVIVTRDTSERVGSALTADEAHLIAAAPELYGNAEFLCDRLRDLEGYDGDELMRQLMGHVQPALSRMEMALAKARGEQ